MEDGLRSEKPAFFSAVPVELDGLFQRRLGGFEVLDEHPESLQDGDSTAAIIVRTWCGKERREEQVDAVLVGADYNGALRLARDPGNDGRLRPAVGERGKLEMSIPIGSLVDTREEPFRGLAAVVGLLQSAHGTSKSTRITHPEVPRVEARKLLQILPHVILVQMLKQRSNLVFELHLIGKDDLLLREHPDLAQVLVVGDVHEILALSLERKLVGLRNPSRLGRRELDETWLVVLGEGTSVAVCKGLKLVASRHKECRGEEWSEEEAEGDLGLHGGRVD